MRVYCRDKGRRSGKADRERMYGGTKPAVFGAIAIETPPPKPDDTLQ